jgi:hypothetical protein
MMIITVKFGGVDGPDVMPTRSLGKFGEVWGSLGKFGEVDCLAHLILFSIIGSITPFRIGPVPDWEVSGKTLLL